MSRHTSGHGQFGHLYRTHRWRKLSEAHREREPLCRMCAAEGRVTVGNVCDHVNGHPADETEQMFWAGPFQTLCHEHHNSDKKLIESGKHRVTIGLDGWPA